MKLYPFQRHIVDRAKSLEHYAFFCDMGTGKSAMVLNTVKDFSKVIIFTPKITIRNWIEEFRIWKPGLVVNAVLGTSKQKIATINKSDIIVINYESVRSNEVFCNLLRFRPVTVICDESHRLKSYKAIQTKRIIDISKSAKNKYIMSGTPITNSYEDIFSQYLFLDDGKSFGTNYFAFRGKYFVNMNAGWTSNKAFPNWQLNEGMKEDFKKIVSSKATFLKKEACLDLPELVETKIEIPLSTEQKRHYEEIKKDLITWLDENPDNPLVTQNALTKLMRLNEVISGYMKMSDDTVHVFKENHKMEALMEILEDLSRHKVIVFCCFKQNYLDISKQLSKREIKYVEIHGGIKDKDKFANIDKFNDMNSGVKVAIVNPGSGGIGINMKAASYSIYYSRDFNLEKYLQSKARNYRAGSVDLHNKITHINLISSGTLDVDIYKSLQEKKNLLSSLSNIRNLISKGDN